jgi:hypothetical protein
MISFRKSENDEPAEEIGSGFELSVFFITYLSSADWK